MKGPDGRGLRTKEETMSTFTTITDLQRLTDRELDILHLAATQRHSVGLQSLPTRLRPMRLAARDDTADQGERD
jgi:hypothetical protein